MRREILFGCRLLHVACSQFLGLQLHPLLLRSQRLARTRATDRRVGRTTNDQIFDEQRALSVTVFIRLDRRAVSN